MRGVLLAGLALLLGACGGSGLTDAQRDEVIDLVDDAAPDAAADALADTTPDNSENDQRFADLEAEIAALNGRIAQLEAQAIYWNAR